jgi:hypothetical protein
LTRRRAVFCEKATKGADTVRRVKIHAKGLLSQAAAENIFKELNAFSSHVFPSFKEA